MVREGSGDNLRTSLTLLILSFLIRSGRFGMAVLGSSLVIPARSELAGEGVGKVRQSDPPNRLLACRGRPGKFDGLGRRVGKVRCAAWRGMR